VTGAIAMTGDCAVIAKLAVEQTGQMCEADGAAVRSVQEWNCAPRKAAPRSNARMRMRRNSICMCLLRWSLGKKGWGVKQTISFAGHAASNQPGQSTV
jgi:hypothetical protein